MLHKCDDESTQNTSNRASTVGLSFMCRRGKMTNPSPDVFIARSLSQWHRADALRVHPLHGYFLTCASVGEQMGMVVAPGDLIQHPSGHAHGQTGQEAFNTVVSCLSRSSQASKRDAVLWIPGKARTFLSLNWLGSECLNAGRMQDAGCGTLMPTTFQLHLGTLYSNASLTMTVLPHNEPICLAQRDRED